MKKVLLTGATGFVGQNVTKKLKEKYDLLAIGSKDCDLRSQYKCEKLIDDTSPDIIVHIAGTVGGIGANKENPGKFMYENLVMGTNLINKAKENNISKFIMLGTVCAYPKFTQVPFKESDLWLGYPEETNAPYGIAKKILMKMIETYHEQYGFNGINLIPANMYGPYDHFNLTSSHVIPAMILKVKKAIENKEKFIELWGTGQASREFLYVDDCVDAIQLAIEKDVPPSPINIGTGKEIKISTLAETICEIMSFDGDIKYDLSKPDGQPRRSLDVSMAKDLLGFQAKTDLKEGLKKTFDWFILNTRG
jgi:GDP-L-fucose synthase